MYVYRNTEVRSCNPCCRRKAISITYSEWVFVALGIQHSLPLRLIVVCGLSVLYIIFPHYLINGTIFEKGCTPPWSRALLEKLTGSAASQKIPHIFGTRRFITVLTSARHLSLS